jgi:hypothetical protein
VVDKAARVASLSIVESRQASAGTGGKEQPKTPRGRCRPPIVAGAEGATAPETLRQKDREAEATLESGRHGLACGTGVASPKE